MLHLLLTATVVVSPTNPACTPQRPMDQVIGRASRYDSVTATVGRAVVKVCYSRPKANGRAIFGALVPLDTLWRTGANEPTTLHVSAPVTLAGIRLDAGSYSLYTVPRAGTHWDVVINRSTTQWGHEGRYHGVRDQEMARARVEAVVGGDMVEEFTIVASPPGLVLSWERTRVALPLAPAS